MFPDNVLCQVVFSIICIVKIGFQLFLFLMLQDLVLILTVILVLSGNCF